MAFLRIKKIKGNEYAYLAENKWMKRRKKVKQSAKKYLGRVYRLSKINDVDFFSFLKVIDVEKYIEQSDRIDLIYDVLKWELYRHGFIEKRNVWRKDELYVNLRLKRVMNDGKDVVLGLNEGYLSGHTLSRLIRYKAYVPDDAYDMAKFFVEAGVEIPKEMFVGIFSKFDVNYEDY